MMFQIMKQPMTQKKIASRFQSEKQKAARAMKVWMVGDVRRCRLLVDQKKL